MKQVKFKFPASILVIGLAMMLMIDGCVTNKKTTYLQEYADSQYEMDTTWNESYRIQANDNLYIRVITPDLRYAEMFNTVPVATPTISATEQSVDLLSYVVEPDGTIELPYLGLVQVKGLTLREAKEVLTDQLSEYVSDVSVTVKLVNYYVSILGEVTVPGRYPVYKQEMNIFQALAMAGDIDDYGNRFRVQIIRPTPEGSKIKEFDLTDKSIVDSEYYYVMPNDVIYVEPSRGKFFAMNQFPFALILTTISTTILILSFMAQ